jgi:hypothetical protein
LNLELEGGAVVADDLEGRRCVFLAALYRAEREIAEKLKTLAAEGATRPRLHTRSPSGSRKPAAFCATSSSSA